MDSNKYGWVPCTDFRKPTLSFKKGKISIEIWPKKTRWTLRICYWYQVIEEVELCQRIMDDNVTGLEESRVMAEGIWEKFKQEVNG